MILHEMKHAKASTSLAPHRGRADAMIHPAKNVWTKTQFSRVSRVRGLKHAGTLGDDTQATTVNIATPSDAEYVFANRTPLAANASSRGNKGGPAPGADL